MNILIEYTDVIDISRQFLEYALKKSSHFACHYYLSLEGTFEKRIGTLKTIIMNYCLIYIMK